MKTTMILALATGLALACASGASAQSVDPRTQVDLSVGGQVQPSTFASSSTFSLYGETGAATSSQKRGQGIVVDGGIGYFVRKRFSIGAGVSVGTRGAGNVTLTTPDPLAFNSFTVVSASPKLRQTEVATHVRLGYRLRLANSLDLTLAGGPSLVYLSKEIATGHAGDGTTQIATEKQTGTGFGAHGGIDANYVFTPRLGVGAFVRYVWAEVDLPAVSGVKVGGVQGGGGLRLRF